MFAYAILLCMSFSNFKLWFSIFRPSVLDNFALLSGQLYQLNRSLKSDKIPPLKNYAVIPLALSPLHDPEVEVFLLTNSSYKYCNVYFLVLFLIIGLSLFSNSFNIKNS